MTGSARDARLRRRSEFDRVQRHGLRVHAGPFIVIAWSAPGAEHARLGLAVSRRVGNAVVRNRVRRLIREVFRALAAELPAADLVVIAKPEASAVGALGLSAVTAALAPGLRKAAARAVRDRS